MAISHLSSGEVASLLPVGALLEQVPSTALFKESYLEVMRIVLLAGKRIPAHAVDGPITVQCLEGEVAFGMRHEHRLLRTLDLIYLAAGTTHELTAVTTASLLMTVVLLSPTDASAAAGERRKHHDDNLAMKQTEDK